MPFSFGVRTIVISNNNKVLLVKHSYKADWYIPGGNLACCEEAAKGAVREVYEETSLKITNLKLVLVEKNIEGFSGGDPPVFFSSIMRIAGRVTSDSHSTSYRFVVGGTPSIC